ncbi:MAG TPA: hypothetical protein DIT13_00200 [Verrucomicrobiales bacterium]|nr:hypothetical protein [Verrucomicrobiales bacterium]HRJ10224.1 transposase [Prosthecobacter sp.]HRK13297.1 transposase [Prosthecobacter sp.]
MPFQPFSDRKPVRIYYTNMPHWRQEGCTYFVTYRLADSIPENVLHQWEREKLHWLSLRGIHVEKWPEGFARLDPAAQHAFLKHFNRALNRCLDDGHGSCALRDTECQRIIADGWRHFAGMRYELGDLVVMPNHVHLLLTPLPGHELEDLMGSRKRQSAREINLRLNREGDFWQKHSYDHIVRDEIELRAFQKYIAENTAKARLRQGEYLHLVP